MVLPKRKPIRLRGYDYSQSGAYFVTIGVSNRDVCLWQNAGAAKVPKTGSILPQTDVQLDIPVHLSRHGTIIEEAINNIPKHYPHIEVNKYCIMPDHIHMILFMLPGENGRILSAPTASLSTVIGQMKRWVSKQIGLPIWQKSFYDHIIRSEKAYREVWQYIDENPLKWREDMINL